MFNSNSGDPLGSNEFTGRMVVTLSGNIKLEPYQVKSIKVSQEGSAASFVNAMTTNNEFPGVVNGNVGYRVQLSLFLPANRSLPNFRDEYLRTKQPIQSILVEWKAVKEFLQRCHFDVQTLTAEAPDTAATFDIEFLGLSSTLPQ